MSKTPIDRKETLATKKPAVLLLGTLADVTWRMFVPTILFALIGAYFDTTYHLEPVFTVIGGFSGFGISAYLIYRQLKKDF